MPNSIFINENFFNMSDPQPAWLFHVFFYKSTGTSKIDDDHLIAETATLPRFETVTVTKKYFGSEKTFPVVRNYGTDLTFRFVVRAEPSDNNQLYNIAQINSRCLKDLMDSAGILSVRSGSEHLKPPFWSKSFTGLWAVTTAWMRFPELYTDGCSTL